jgi:succinate dehydrogenase/fumarate reductase flavoprotein subunit
VVLAAGGFSHDPALRQAHLPAAAGALSATSPASTGDGVRFGLAAGGQVGRHNIDNAFWVPVSRFRRADGSVGVYPHTVTDRAKPGLIAVDRSGRRFVNEAVSYHEFVLAMFRNDNAGAGPAYLICDRRFLWRYGLGRVKPLRLSTRDEIRSFYLFAAPTVRGLAQAIGIDPDALAATVESFNADAVHGRDPAFGRGGDSYQRHLGDAEHRPNPCVAPITRPPFHAVAVYPADLGTAAGLVTDASACVLASDGAPIPGLYACGNDMNSVMRGAYPGPGITLGPALTFGYLAARHAAARRL